MLSDDSSGAWIVAVGAGLQALVAPESLQEIAAWVVVMVVGALDSAQHCVLC